MILTSTLGDEGYAIGQSNYFSALRESHRFDEKQTGDTVNRIKVGDVVLVHSDTEKRLNWQLAIVTELKMAKDNMVRSTAIKTKHGISNRPITNLYPLEVCSTLYDRVATESPKSFSLAEVPVPVRTRQLSALVLKYHNGQNNC